MKALLLVPWLLFSTVHAEEGRISTVAGEMQYTLDEKTRECTFLLNEKPIHKINCEAAFLPKVIGHFREGLGPVDQLVVVQENPMGNACNGGPLHLIGLRKDRSYSVSAPLDFCGGKDPVLRRDGKDVFITFPGGPPNRGTGRIPAERWVYRDGQVKEAR
ncbi:MAG: hypothetical protein KIT18_04860 [Burkholderiales bacterium]|nr:hypothetical protein [Burkholderiales bacterium]